jgi:hypothetical protein
MMTAFWCLQVKGGHSPGPIPPRPACPGAPQSHGGIPHGTVAQERLKCLSGPHANKATKGLWTATRRINRPRRTRGSMACNARHHYSLCMPAGGVSWLSQE